MRPFSPPAALRTSSPRAMGAATDSWPRPSWRPFGRCARSREQAIAIASVTQQNSFIICPTLHLDCFRVRVVDHPGPFLSPPHSNGSRSMNYAYIYYIYTGKAPLVRGARGLAAQGPEAAGCPHVRRGAGGHPQARLGVRVPALFRDQ